MPEGFGGFDFPMDSGGTGIPGIGCFWNIILFCIFAVLAIALLNWLF